MPKLKKPPSTLPTVKRAVIYARVSSREQAEEGYSIDAQLRFLRDYCAANDLIVSREFVEVETAKRSGRREFERMVEYVRSNGVGAVVAEKIDRLYRNLKDPATIEELGIERHFAKEGGALTDRSRSHEKFIHDIKLVLAKNYCDNLSEEARKGMMEKAKQGVHPAQAPLGYLNVAEGSRRGIAVDPERAPIVRQVFEEYARGGHSVKTLTKRARSLGLRTRKGNTLPTSSIDWILRNPMYYGLIRWDGRLFPGTHKPLVSKEIWDKVQDVLHGRNNIGNVGYGLKDFTYKGLFTCGHCGCVMTAEIKKGKYVYYHCTGRRGTCPGQKSIREEAITEQLSGILAGLRIEPEICAWLKDALRESLQEAGEVKAAQLERLEAARVTLRRRLEQLYADKISGDVPASVYPTLKERWESELAEVDVAIRAAEAADSSYYDEGVALLELAQNAHLEFKSADSDDRRELLRYLGSNFKILEGKVVVELRNSFKTMFEANQQVAGMAPNTMQSEIWSG